MTVLGSTVYGDASWVPWLGHGRDDLGSQALSAANRQIDRNDDFACAAALSLGGFRALRQAM